jgi:signal transduction histidine kinase/ligand-binding sensor domain-containing protein
VLFDITRNRINSKHIWLGVVSRLSVGAAACSFLFAPPVGAADTSPASIQPLDSEYLIESWQTEQGLPDNYVNAIAQTPDGYLWIATFNGLARFNGLEFVVFDPANTPELPSARIVDLQVDRRGRLWIKSERGHLTEWASGRFMSFGESRGLPDAGIGLLREDPAGDIWASSYWDITNYHHLVDGIFKPTSSTNTFYQRFGNSLDSAGYGWGIRGNILFSAGPKPIEAVVPSFAMQGWRLAASSDGGMWIVANRIQKYHPPSSRAVATSPPVHAAAGSSTTNPGWFEDFGPVPVVTDNFTSYREDRSGNLWVGTGVGELWRIGANHDFRRFKFQNTTTLELGRSIFVDAEGNLWIGNGGDGLVRLKRRTLKSFDSRDGLASDVVRSVTEDKDGNVWLATVNSVDWFPSSTGRTGAASAAPKARPRGVPVVLPWRVYGTRGGAVWVGTYGEGLLRLQGTEAAWFKESRRGLDGGPPITGIFEDHQGQMYFASAEGLYGIKDNCLAKCDWPDTSKDRDIGAIAEDGLGHLYIGLNNDGLLHQTKTGWQHFTIADGLAENRISALYVDRDGAVWIGTHRQGLTRFQNGRFFNFVQLNLDLPRLINSILEDDTGHLWFGSNQGLFRAERRQLNQLADDTTTLGGARQGRAENLGPAHSINVTHYDRNEGMGSGQCTGDARKAHDGKLWFATMKGVTVVDPESLPFNHRPPPVVVEGVLIDDALQAVKTSATTADKSSIAGPRISVPPGVHRLEVRYAGLSFTAPERVRFQYRLAPFEKDWINAGTRRAAYYTRVPPGSYQFQVLACNNDNVWNQTGTSIAVVVQPLLWQTAWFRALAILCGVGFAAALYELRVLRLKRQQAMQESFSRSLIESQENERKRIAAELHDSLGQSLLVVKNYAAMALKEPKLEEKTQRQLHEISQSASASIEEVRSIARALRPYQLDRFGLTKTLEDATKVAAHAGRLEIATSVENIDGSISPEGEISVYRIVQEWLNNVVKHGRASKARLAVHKADGLIHMILEDDGVGFDYDTVMKRSPGGFGLANLSERARLLGGTLKIETAPGKGTRLLVDLPCKR